jgi:iron complex outermembrane receptor protein
MKNRIQRPSSIDGVLQYLAIVLVAASSVFTLLASPNAAAQDKASASTPVGFAIEEITVTARKRDETSLAVPVTITAIGAMELERRAIGGLDALAKTVSGLAMQEQGGTIQGGTVSMRGITGPNSNALGDQAVSFNMDGVAIARSTVRRLGAFDLEQVEVLKGPQALFFGKNSPGGVISLRSADPTESFDSKIALGYDGEGREFRTDAYVSGPLSENLGGRLAIRYNDLDGYVRNTYPAGFPLSPANKRGPSSREVAVRGTLKFDNGGPFSARLKVSAADLTGAGIASGWQPFYCVNNGHLQQEASLVPGAADDCRADDRVSRSDMGTSFTAFDPRFKSQPYTKQKQELVGLEMNFNVTDMLQLASVTGYYHADVAAADYYSTSAPIWLVPSAQNYEDKEYSQELRLSSNYEGAVNFMVGALYGTTDTAIDVHSLFGGTPPATNAFGLPSPTAFNQYRMTQKGTSYSAFAQLSWKIAPTVELSAGGRYSSEDKKLSKALASFFLSNPNYGVGLTSFTVPKLKATDFSPEVTVSWRPRESLNTYVSYKRGFLSGGYNGSSDVLLPNQKATYDQQNIRGFEGGVKAKLLNDAVRVNFAVYDYDVIGLQVASYQQGISTIRNAGKVGVKGAEADFAWNTTVSGLQLRGGVAYNRARYNIYVAPCYGGQTQALGCTIRTLPGLAIPDAQNLAGTPVPNAPEIVANAGFDYQRAVGTGYKLGLSTDINYSDSYVTDSKNTPFSEPPAQSMIDASIRFGKEDDRWELALVGRNLTNEFYWTDSQGVFGTGSGTGGAAGTVGVLQDRVAFINRGRELWLRLSAKFN